MNSSNGNEKPGTDSRLPRRSYLKLSGLGGLFGAATLSQRAEAIQACGSGSTDTPVATTDGRWDDPGTWSGETLPADGDDVLIEAGVTVTVDGETDRVQHVVVEGTLRHDPSRDSLLRAETVELTSDGRYEMGTESTPIEPEATATLAFVDHGPIDTDEWPERNNKGLIGMGDIEISGAEKTSWTTLADPPTAGDTTLELTAEPINWQAGDTLVLPGLTPYESAALDHEDDECVIESASGSTITLTEPLEYDHVPPADDLDSYVLNLSRNARCLSESDDPARYGHIMIHAPGQRVAYLELRNVGRTDKKRDPTEPLWGRGEADPAEPPNPRGRYAIHAHLTGPTTEAHRIVGCAIRDNPGWGIVNHGSNMVATDNVTYNIAGAGLVTERGNEAGAFRRNFALRSAGSGEEVDSRKGWDNGAPNTMEDPPHNVDDFGHHGCGFWIHSPIVEVTDNVAAGHRAHGYVFYHRSLYEQALGDGEALDGKNDMFPDLPRELLSDDEQAFGRDGTEDSAIETDFHEADDSLFFSQSCRLRAFESNECFASGAGCSFRSVSHRNIHDRPEWATPSGFTAYNIGPHFLKDGSEQSQFVNFESSGNVGIDHRYVGNLVHDDYRLIGTGGGVGSGVNLSYTNGFDLHNSTIENFEYGYVPKAYNETGTNVVENCTFDNETDILLVSRFYDNQGGLALQGNTYNGTNRLEWQELKPQNMHPRRFLSTEGVDHTGCLFENRTLYHGWSNSDFVICQADDDERLEEMLNHGFDDYWVEALDGDDPREVLPGATHQELYDEYGISFYGGIQDPDQEGFEQPEDLVGSDSTYDTTPFFGPETKTQPTDEIWADVRAMDTRGDIERVDADSDPELAGAVADANGDDLLRLTVDSHHSDPPTDGDGILGFEFSVDTPGVYHCRLRCHIPRLDDSNDDNRRVWFRINGGEWTRSEENLGKVGDTGLDWLTVSRSIELSPDDNPQQIELATVELPVTADWLSVAHETVGAPPLGRGKAATE